MDMYSSLRNILIFPRGSLETRLAMRAGDEPGSELPHDLLPGLLIRI
jgi:hypothetical protein